jgi:uncharacterized protein (DUF2336 family)
VNIVSLCLLRQVECVPRHPFSDHRGLSGDCGADIRPALLRELTDLYVQKPSHTPEETRLFTELALRLIEHVDTAERARLGARLTAYPGAPLEVIRRLAEPDVLPHSQVPAQALPRIEEPPREETLSDAFFNASSAERRLILLHLDYAPIAPAPVQAGAVERLERATMTRQRSEFSATLEDMLSISATCAQRIANDSTGEAVIAALKALAVPSPVLQRILLFLDPAVGQSADTYFSLVRLYDEIGHLAARRLVAIWRRDDVVPSRKGEHQRQLFDDRRPHARDFARHDARQTAGRPSGSDQAQRQGQTEV